MFTFNISKINILCVKTYIINIVFVLLPLWYNCHLTNKNKQHHIHPNNIFYAYIHHPSVSHFSRNQQATWSRGDQKWESLINTCRIKLLFLINRHMLDGLMTTGSQVMWNKLSLSLLLTEHKLSNTFGDWNPTRRNKTDPRKGNILEVIKAFLFARTFLNKVCYIL